MSDSVKDWVGFAAVCCVVLVIVFSLVNVASRYECENKWASSGLATRYQFIGGCLVEASPGHFIPEGAYRVLP